ncbi:uncharacterized protein LOC143914242 isoform X2 [Arctopsyche grandis]|uniref:uncharacterized protein LOC143914242 isoform X2 n=1 Tax=Arctopsyche grandis TaxID=121162 RepID=UPI00406D7736
MKSVRLVLVLVFSFKACYCNPLSSNSSSALDSGDVFQNTTYPLTTTTGTPTRSFRTGKAIGHSPKTPILFSTPIPQLKTSIIFPLATSSDVDDDGPSSIDLPLQPKLKKDKAEPQKADLSMPTETPVQNETNKPDVSIEITTATSAPPVQNNQTINDTPVKNDTDEHILVEPLLPVESVTVEAYNTTPSKNATEEVQVNTIKAVDTDVKNESVPVLDEVDEVEISTVRALSLETAVGRRAADIPIVSGPGPSQPDSGLDAAAVAGICFGTLVVLALGGATSFVLYRRRYLNKPQTLNDKCSNPDSSGYIDDSTIRENSEEMYSLDNDSFLNSLEAMTIQNYWTDSVKHTKL